MLAVSCACFLVCWGSTLLASGSSYACHWVAFFSSLVVAPGNVVFVLEHGSVAQAGLEPRVGLRRYV